MAVQDQPVETRTLTVEAFWEEYAGQPYELVHGKVVEVGPAGALHGAVTRRIAARLGDYADTHHLGEVFGAETGFYLAEDTLRGADVAFISREKWLALEAPEKYLPFPPDLAVEVVSPTDRTGDTHDKIRLYLAAGTQQVWVVYPQARTVVVHLPDGSARTLSADDSLDGGDLLPGFTLPVADCFPPPREANQPE